MHSIHSEDFTHKGLQFHVTLYPDDTSEAPWEECDGHGPVRFISDSEPLQRGETVLYDCPRGRYVYDWGRAIVQAAREGWGLGADDLAALAQRLGKRPTRAQVRAEAVRKDMTHLRGWCADDWCYIGVCVQRIGPDGEPVGDEFAHALWGVESCGDYWREVAAELAGEMLPDERAQECALTEEGA